MEWIVLGIKDGLRRVNINWIILYRDPIVPLLALFLQHLFTLRLRSDSNACSLDFNGCSSIEYSVGHARGLTETIESLRVSMNGTIYTLCHW